MKKTSYEVEYDIDMIVQDLRSEYNLEADFYGDCHPYDVNDLKTKMYVCRNEEDYQYYLNEIEEIFKGYIGSSIDDEYEL